MAHNVIIADSQRLIHRAGEVHAEGAGRNKKDQTQHQGHNGSPVAPAAAPEVLLGQDSLQSEEAARQAGHPDILAPAVDILILPDGLQGRHPCGPFGWNPHGNQHRHQGNDR